MVSARGLTAITSGLLMSLAVSMSSGPVLADELEEGLRYTCDHTGLTIDDFSADGGGQEAPFEVSDADSRAVWNVSRIDPKRLPIVKQCRVGAHRVTAVISERCATGSEISVSVAVYSDSQITVNQSAQWFSLDKVKADHAPILNAVLFGFLCEKTTEVVFSKIVVKPDPSNAHALALEMR